MSRATPYGSSYRNRSAYQWSVEVSAYVREDRQGRGIARGLYAALFGILETQGYVTALAGIALPNPASVGFHEAMGFQHLGTYRNVGFKLGSWHDVGWWQRSFLSPPTAPRPPIPFATIRGSAEWSDQL